MGDYGLIELGRSLMQSFYGAPAVGLTGCTAQGLEDACSANGNLPEAGSPFADSESLDSSGFATFDQPVRFVLPNAETCAGGTTGLEVTFSLGDIIDAPMTLNADGSYSITIDAFNWSTDYNAVVITITDLEQETSITKNMAPPTVIPNSDVDTCESNPDPAILPGYSFHVYPNNSIDAGTTAIVALPLEGVAECDSSNDSLSAYVIINGEEADALLINEYLSEDGMVSLSEPHFVLERRFNTGGAYPVTMIIVDGSRPDADPVALTEQTIYVNETDSQCYEIPAPGSFFQVPDDSDLLRGSDTLFTWTQNDLADCNNDDLILLSDNRTEILFNPTVSYSGGTLDVSGQILPEITGGTLRFEFEDAYGIPKIFNIFLPTIEPVSLQTTSLFIQEGAPATFVASTIPGATNYRFWVTMPGEIDDAESNLPGSTYIYTPLTPGEYVLNLEITTYNGSTIMADYPFIAAAAPGPSDDVCYSIPGTGLVNQSPIMASITRGDNTFFSFTVSGIMDCLGGDLILYDDNASDILYSESVSYIAQGLTVDGRIRSTYFGGTIQVRFIDTWGHMKIVNIFPPSINEPTLIADFDPYITLSENVDLQCSADPAGATFNYAVTRPNLSIFSSGSLSSSSWLISSGQTPQTGVYIVDLDILAGDGVTIPVLGTFAVHED